jgi:mono/diheme cytochrome c family protein
MTPARTLLAAVACFLFLPAVRADDARPAVSPEAAEFFEKRVRPILAERCFSCHGPDKQKGGLRLDSAADLAKGSVNGPVVAPGDPAKSPLVAAVGYAGDTKMPPPPRPKLSAEAVDALTAWVKMGAPWPAERNPAAVKPTVADVRAKHWSFQPVRKLAPPAVKDADWPASPIDNFVLAKLQEKGLAPSRPADKRTLIRRVTFDLIGLPPTPEEVDAFLADESAGAFAKVVDRLLADPRYGERWARHWLDVARYADTKGYVFTEERRYPFAWTYRDYVVRSFNDDLPYDRFVVEQLAADRVTSGDDKRPLAAMGFLTLGRRFLNNTHDIIDDRIDVVSRGLLGLTVACARCHDHKFDPIPTKDYYSLYGVFASSVEPKDLPVIASPTPSPASEAFEKELAQLKEDAAKYEMEHQDELKANNRAVRDELRKRQQKVETLKVTHPGAPPSAMVLTDAPQPTEPHVLVRGNPNNRGDAVPRQFLEVLSVEARKPFTDGSGRLELARAIADPKNPLTARVFVNRVWQHHFGEGLVRTPGDFGLRGEPPTHPELLDWLAATFVEEGWSVKQLHRLILLSRTYQQASDVEPKAQAVDVDNRLLWRMNRRRLEFEPLRDSLLAAAGRLDARQGGPAVELTTGPFSTRRSVYGFIDRQNLPGLYRTFDLASPDTATPQRHETTVPQQALFLMNSPFLIEQAKAVAARPDVAALADPEARVRRLYLVLYGRPADAEEVALGTRFVATAKAGPGLTPWEQYAQVLLLANEFVTVD